MSNLNTALGALVPAAAAQFTSECHGLSVSSTFVVAHPGVALVVRAVPLLKESDDANRQRFGLAAAADLRLSTGAILHRKVASDCLLPGRAAFTGTHSTCRSPVRRRRCCYII